MANFASIVSTKGTLIGADFLAPFAALPAFNEASFLTGVQSLQTLQSLHSQQSLSCLQAYNVLQGMAASAALMQEADLATAGAQHAINLLAGLETCGFASFISASSLSYLSSIGGDTFIQDFYTLLKLPYVPAAVSYLRNINSFLTSAGGLINTPSVFAPIIDVVGTGDTMLQSMETVEKLLGEFDGLHDIFAKGGLMTDGDTLINTLVPQMDSAGILTDSRLTGAEGASSTLAVLATLNTFAG